MNIQETVSIENPVETTEATTNNGDIQEHLDMPVARANAVAFILLQRIYSTDDETTKDESGSVLEFIDSFVHQQSCSGSADVIHNFAGRIRLGLGCPGCRYEPGGLREELRLVGRLSSVWRQLRTTQRSKTCL